MRFLIGSLFGSKRELLQALLDKGMVMIHLDARRDGVDVPVEHRGDPHLRLNLSLNFGLDDFVIDDVCASASLSFGGRRQLCQLPWSAIFALTSHVEPLGYLWPDELPPELANQLGAGTATTHGPAVRPALTVVAREDSEELDAVRVGDAPSEVLGDVSDKRRYGHLRVVK